MDQIVFGWIDYLLFTSLLAISILIGFYFGLCSKQNSANEYLFGGKNMGYVPVALSILASTYSGVTLIGIPTEIYLYGAHAAWWFFSTTATILFMNYVSLPLFFKLEISNAYDYLEIRFSRKVKVFISILYILSLTGYLPLMIYGPVIALSQTTGFSLNIIAPVLCGICVIYTTLGGVKAVIWTDTVQFVFTAGGLISVLALGLQSVGGFSNMWNRCVVGKRLDITNFSLSPFTRNTVWNQTFGDFALDLAIYAFAQKLLQRYFSISKLENIQKAVWINYVGSMFVLSSSILTGLIIYAKYHDCDPISAGLIERSDQILAFYVMDTTKNLSGLSGIFLASITSAGLSTMSAGINSLSGIIYDTFIKSHLSTNSNSSTRAATIMKIISILIGLVTIGLIFVFDKMGTILQMTTSLQSTAYGPMVGLFLMGMFLPWVNEKGALTGGCVSFVVMLWMSIGSQWYSKNDKIHYPKLPLTTEKCSDFLNTTIMEDTDTILPLDPSDEPFFIYRISFYYFVFFGTITAIATGLFVSFIFKETDMVDVNPEHIVPSMRRFLPKKTYNEVPLNELHADKKSDVKNM